MGFGSKGTCTKQEDCSKDRQSCINSHCVVNNYTCFNGYYCSSFYGNSISGSKDFIAMECSSDVNCRAFRYSPKNGFGFKCKDSHPTNNGMSYGYEKNDWTLCKFDSATCCQSISVTASGQVKSKHSSRMGKFLFYKMGLNGRPIYTNSKGQYLYLASDGDWSIGADYSKTGAWIYHRTCIEECPNQCTNKWQHWDNGWHVDSSIKISCESINVNTSKDGVRNETGLIHSSNDSEDMKPGLVFFVAGFIVLILGILTLIILSRIF